MITPDQSAVPVADFDPRCPCYKRRRALCGSVLGITPTVTIAVCTCAPVEAHRKGFGVSQIKKFVPCKSTHRSTVSPERHRELVKLGLRPGSVWFNERLKKEA